MHGGLLTVIAVMLISCLCLPPVWAAKPAADERATARQWVEAQFEGVSPAPPAPGLQVISNHDPVQKNGRFGKPLKIGAIQFTRGLFCHAPSKIVVRLPGQGKLFTAVIGVDNNDQTSGGRGTVVFSVSVDNAEVFRSEVMRGGQEGMQVRVPLERARELSLEITDAGDGISCDQADWADARVFLENGESVWLADLVMAQGPVSADPGNPPFSFTYAGRSSTELLKSWKMTRESKSLDDTRTQHTITYADPDTGLEVRWQGIAYQDFPSVEWTLHFKNMDTRDSPIIENIRALDIGMERGDAGEFLLHHFVGSPCQINDYEPLETALTPNSTTRIAGARGRATSSDLCYFNIQSTCGDGLIVGLGWPGQWAAEFARDGAKILRVRAGQELTHFKLLPGEEVRAPLVALQFWQGDWGRAQNVWREWMIEHNLPRPGGKALAPFITADTSAQFGEMINANEENQIYFIDRYIEERLKIDYWWMDAGWYVCDGSWPKTGTWEVDTKRFPRGLRAITDHAHAKGINIIVWFEPERVAPGTWLADNHPEWVLGGKNGGLLDLGNPDARQWLTDHVDKLLTDQGIDLYRQDFNMDPLDLWRGNDAEDRQGITEIKHIEGLFTYWDELRRRHPNLLIDTCASGGRRNDLETLRRAVPLWRTDCPFNPTATQCHTYGISFWIPLSGTGVKVIDNYDFRSNAAPEFTCHWDLREKGLDYDLMRRQLQEWRQYSANFMGDYYPLTPYSTDTGAWMAWQFDRPESGQGMVQVFRRPDSVYLSAQFPLKGLDAQSQYAVKDMDKDEVLNMTGRDLMEKGLPVTIPGKPAALVFVYRKTPPSQ